MDVIVVGLSSFVINLFTDFRRVFQGASIPVDPSDCTPVSLRELEYIPEIAL